MDRLEEIKKKFHILDNWTITIGSDRRLDKTPYTGECTFNLDRHTATIYPWDTNKPEPSNYIFHEILHIALRATLIDREHEELFVQDLCIQLEEKDQEIERSKKEKDYLLTLCAGPITGCMTNLDEAKKWVETNMRQVLKNG